MSRSCYIVKNVSSNLVTLSDLRVEIAPGATLDLEKVTKKVEIERSMDLIHALKKAILKIVKIKKPDKVQIPKQLSKDEMQALLDQALKKAMEKSVRTGNLDITSLQKTIEREVSSNVNKQVEGKLDDLLNAVKSLQNSGTISGSKNETTISPDIDLEKLAAIAQKGAEQIAAEIENSQSSQKKAQKIKIPTSATNLANELD